MLNTPSRRTVARQNGKIGRMDVRDHLSSSAFIDTDGPSSIEVGEVAVDGAAIALLPVSGAATELEGNATVSGGL